MNEAVRDGDIQRIRTLLQSDRPTDALTDSYAALHIAAFAQQHEAAKVLLAHGASPTVEDGFDGNTPMHYAAGNGDVEMLRLLLPPSSTASPDVCNMDSMTPLHTACLGGHRAACEYLLELGASVHATDTDGDTPLHLACLEGHAHLAFFLVTRGADIHAKNDASNPPELRPSAVEQRMAHLRSLCTCPVTHALFRDPVVAADGHTYERRAVAEWLQRGNTRSIRTNDDMPCTSVVPNYSMRWIAEWVALHLT